jgi:hypothetical protein
MDLRRFRQAVCWTAIGTGATGVAGGESALLATTDLGQKQLIHFFQRVNLYARTARHLRWRQLFYRPLRDIQGVLPFRITANAEVSLCNVPALSAQVSAWMAPRDNVGSRAKDILEGKFCFLNHSVVLEEMDWKVRKVSHLWNYNLHYFDYALDLAWAYRLSKDNAYRDRFADLALSWIEGTDPGHGDGWEPYAVSVRTVNWIYSLLLFGRDFDASCSKRLENSLVQQMEFLSRRLEWHILGNHLQKNLKALIIGGLFFSGPAPQQWLRNGLRLLWRELFEHVLADGGHFERSPMYHVIALADFLELVSLLQAAGDPPPETTVTRIRRMVAATGALSSRTGRLHLFNDTALGIAPPRSWVSSLARSTVGEEIPEVDGVIELSNSGYFGLADSVRGERLLIDCGPLGPGYQPGHGHCDLLSFEWSLGDRPVVVDSGVRGYDGDALREYVRSTRAHNTVTIDGREQAEVWGTFRVARRPTLRPARHTLEGGTYTFVGAYCPYSDRRSVHHRTLVRDGDGLRIHDRIEGRRGGTATSYLHLHPDFAIEGEGTVRIATAEGLELRIETWGAERVDVERGQHSPAQGWYCPEFGVALPAPVVVLHTRTAATHEFGYRIRILSRDREPGASRLAPMNQ